MSLKFLSAGKRPPKKFHHIRNALRTRSRIASGMAQPHQETSMTSYAVADGTKTRQVDEKAFLEKGR